MNRLTRRAAVALATTAVAFGGVAATAGAALADTGTPAPVTSPVTSPPASPSTSVPATHGKGLTAIQTKAAADIARRLASLNVALTSVGANTFITAADRSTLQGILNNDVTGLTALGQTIAADTTAAKAATDAATIFTTYRVYALALPQVRYAEAADDMTGTVVPKLQAAQTSLVALLAADPSKNTAAVQASMADLASKIAAVIGDTSNLSATVLAYTPAQYDANHALLANSRAALADARIDAKAARADIVAVTKAVQ
jgi:hypothetical protein